MMGFVPNVNLIINAHKTSLMKTLNAWINHMAIRIAPNALILKIAKLEGGPEKFVTETKWQMEFSHPNVLNAYLILIVTIKMHLSAIRIPHNALVIVLD
jgi:hypothetical protein